MPETMSLERRRMLRAFGAELVLTEGAKGMPGAIAKAEEIVAERPEPVLHAPAVQEPGEPRRSTSGPPGPEIWNDTDGKVDIFVAGVGTGGTITGVVALPQAGEEAEASSRWRSSRSHSPVLTAIREGRAAEARAAQDPGHRRRLQARRARPRRSSTRSSTVSNDEAVEMARRLHREEGITCGISCGAAVAAALQVAARPETKGKLIVVVLPDAGERYLSSVLFEGIPA